MVGIVAHDGKLLQIPLRLPVHGPFDDSVEFVILIAWDGDNPFIFPVCNEMGPGEYFLLSYHRKGQEYAVIADENVEYDNSEQREVPPLAEIIRRGILEALSL